MCEALFWARGHSCEPEPMPWPSVRLTSSGSRQLIEKVSEEASGVPCSAVERKGVEGACPAEGEKDS